MRLALFALALVSLAACGADGEPVRPAPKPTTKPGISVSGTARFGISVSRAALDPVGAIRAGF